MANGKANTAGKSASVPFKFFFWGHVFDILRANGKLVVICATVAFCFYQISLALQSFAGQVTFASLTLRIFANIIVKWMLTVSVSGISIALYVREKLQHERTRERLTQRITKLEVQFNPTRTSSQLTTKGRTRKEDE